MRGPRQKSGVCVGNVRGSIFLPWVFGTFLRPAAAAKKKVQDPEVAINI